MKQAITALVFTLFFTALNSKADAAFRCPNGSLVDTGDSIAIVSTKCDPPASVSRRSEAVETETGRIKYVEIQEWVYTAGSTLSHILMFRNGILESISTGGFVR